MVYFSGLKYPLNKASRLCFKTTTGLASSLGYAFNLDNITKVTQITVLTSVNLAVEHELAKRDINFQDWDLL